MLLLVVGVKRDALVFCFLRWRERAMIKGEKGKGMSKYLLDRLYELERGVLAK